MKYVNFKRFSVEYDENNRLFTYSHEKMGRFLRNGCISEIRYGDSTIYLTDYKESNVNAEHIADGRKLTVHYSKGPEILPDLSMIFVIDSDTINFFTDARMHSDVHINADVYWGADPINSTFAVCLEGVGNCLRAAHGPAASRIDNALYDRISDSVLEIDMCDRVRLKFDWEKRCYSLKMDTGVKYHINGFKIKTRDNYYAAKFSVPFRPINKSHQFPTPPVGWMTWYSVQFNASSKTVLENAKWLAENLADYGANCIWVDWEWYHSDMSGKEAPGVDTFNPKKERYPDGLKQVSDEIRKLGLIPALWIGATNDTNLNCMLEKNPDWVLANRHEWCGQWWIDPSHPDVVSKYIPAVFKKLLEWGYEAFKWDCLPVSLNIFDQYHDSFHNKDKSSETAFRDVIKAARDTIGENKYMMSCSGDFTRDIMFAADYFDGARIGGDIFKWDEFIAQSIERALKYYLFHNVLWYADMDNLIVRSEYNNMDQACSRASFYGLTGVPVTLGDNLPELEPERVNLLKRVSPVVDIHPMDIREIKRSAAYILVNLNIAKSFDSWNVIDVLNSTGDKKDVRLDLCGDLYLDTANGEEYCAYDYWNNEFLGIRRESLDLILEPYGSKVVSLHKLSGRPQVVSTSRHITQGAYDIESLEWDIGKCMLRGKSRGTGGEKYRIVLYVPEEYGILGATAGSSNATVTGSDYDRISIVEFTSVASHIDEWNIQFIRKQVENSMTGIGT